MAIDWAKKLEEAGDKRASKPKGKDWFTVHDLKENTGMSNNNCYEYIRSLLVEGKLEKFKGTRYSKEHNMNVRSVWYRFI